VLGLKLGLVTEEVKGQCLQ